MPEKAPARTQNEPLNTKALRSTKDTFISKEAQKVSGEQRNSKLGQDEGKHQREGKRNAMKSFSALIVSREMYMCMWGRWAVPIECR